MLGIPPVLLAMATLGAAEDVQPSFTPGSACADVDFASFLVADGSRGKATTSRALSGKHLRFVELEWSPFSFFNAERCPSGSTPENGYLGCTAGWWGLDIDLLRIVSHKLNFTYDIIAMNQAAGETWTDTLFRHLQLGDIIGCYWMMTSERRDRAYMLNGHIDSSIVMAIPPPVVEEPTLFKKAFTFLEPFEPMLWLVIGIVVLTSGFGYYLIEGLSQGDVYPIESIYEALNVLVYGENPAPSNALARLHAPVWGLVCLVLTACYTANLATFLTLRALPIQRIQSVADIVRLQAPTCLYDSEPLKEEILAQYGHRIENWVHTASYLDAGKALMRQATQAAAGEQTCDAFLLPRIEVGSLQTDKAVCGMRTAGEVLIPNEAGWVTNALSMCVGLAIETELQKLYVRGIVRDLFNIYRPPARCPQLVQKNEAKRLRISDVMGLLVSYLLLLLLLIVVKLLYGQCLRRYMRKDSHGASMGRRLSNTLQKKVFREEPPHLHEDGLDRKHHLLEALMAKVDEIAEKLDGKADKTTGRPSAEALTEVPKDLLEKSLSEKSLTI